MPVRKKKFSVEGQLLLDTHQNPFMIVDMDYNIVAVNQAYCDRYGVTYEEIIGNKCHKISHKSQTPCHMHGEDCPLQSISGGKSCHDTLHIHHRTDGTDDQVRVRGYLITDEDGTQYIGEEVVPETHVDEPVQGRNGLIGSSSAFVKMIELATHAAESSENLLLIGESGTGKDEIARFIHSRSAKNDGPFVSLTCGNTHEAFLGSELFGHERRALPGCSGRRRGLIDDADGGTLYLDEIGDLPMELQSRLIKFMEDGMYSRVGGKETLKSDVRVICSTNHNLQSMIQHRTFRSDLYYRISSISLNIPPLRERRDDIPSLANHFLENISTRRDREIQLDNDAFALLTEYAYPGNIRELKNILTRASNAILNGTIGENDIKNCLAGDSAASQQLIDEKPGPDEYSIQSMEYSHIKHLLEIHHGHRREVANILNISERTLYRKLKKYDLSRTGKDKGS